MGCSTSKENTKKTAQDQSSKETTQEQLPALMNQTSQAVDNVKQDAAVADGKAEEQVTQGPGAEKQNESSATPGPECYEQMVGRWKTQEGEYTLEKDGDKLCYKESGKEPLAGTLLPIDGAQFEGEIYQGLQEKGTLRIRIEGDCVRSYFRLPGKDAFDDVGFLANKVQHETVEPATAEPRSPRSAEPTAANAKQDEQAVLRPLISPMDTLEDLPQAPETRETRPEIEESKVGSLWWSCRCTQ